MKSNGKPKTAAARYARKIRLICIIIAVVTLATFVCCTWFKGDSSLVSYIEEYSLSSSYTPSRTAVISEENGVSVIENDGEKPLRIMQLTDLHIGCGFMTYREDRAVVREVLNAVTAVKPDLIVVTGDALSPIYVRSGTRNSVNELNAFLALMRKTGVPWAFCFGNHDPEGTASKQYISDRLEAESNCLYSRGDETISGYGNYIIKIKSEDKLCSALIFMDTGGGNFLGYDGVHEDQILWYKNTVNALMQEKTDITSILFIHIPINEYALAWEKHISGNKGVIYNLGDNGETISSGTQRGLYSALSECGSTKWVFCGHDHENNFSITMLDTGITLTFGMSMDYSSYLLTKYKTVQRGATVIDVYADGRVKIAQAKQDNAYVI